MALGGAWLSSGLRVPVPVVAREIFQKTAHNTMLHMEQLVEYRSHAMCFFPRIKKIIKVQRWK